jgi:hypothetical protein
VSLVASRADLTDYRQPEHKGVSTASLIEFEELKLVSNAKTRHGSSRIIKPEHANGSTLGAESVPLTISASHNAMDN